jgi:hypothetical protein
MGIVGGDSQKSDDFHVNARDYACLSMVTNAQRNAFGPDAF